MVFPEKKIILKDGRTAIFRAPTPADAAELLRYLEITASETPFLLRSPGENTMTAEQEEQYLQSGLESENKYDILCTVDGRLAGNCRIERRTRQKNCHRANIGIALLQEFWGLGIGTAMFAEMIALAEQWGLMQLELEVLEGNERAIALYRKMGFETVAATPNAIRLQDGTLLKEYLMVRSV